MATNKELVLETNLDRGTKPSQKSKLVPGKETVLETKFDLETKLNLETQMLLDKKCDQELQKLMMSKLIYIPQGFSGRLTSESQQFGIEGLVTDDYGICKILICVSKDRTNGILCHIDVDTVNRWEKIKREIEWVGENQDIYIIARKKDTRHGQIIKDRILVQLLNLKLRHNIHHKYVDSIIDAISFSLRKEGNLAPNIQTYLRQQTPGNLHHHPQEEECLAVQKIEQVIGQRTKIIEKFFRDKRFSIFDGIAWESVASESRLDDHSSYAKDEIAFFKESDNFITIMGKLFGVFQATQVTLQSYDIPHEPHPSTDSLKESARSVAFYMESYLNNFQKIINIFIRNLRDVFENDITPPITNHDKNIQSDMLALKYNETSDKKSTSEKLFEEASKLFEHYQMAAPDSAYKRAVCSEFQHVAEHCKKRLQYEQLRQKNAQRKKQSFKLNADGLQCYKDQDYSKAFSCFLTAIFYHTFSSDKSDDQLSSLYYNCGKTLLKLNCFKQAKHFLSYSVELRKSNQHNTNQNNLIEKSEIALKECQQSEFLSHTLRTLLPQFGLQLSHTSTKLPGDHIMEYCGVGVEQLKI